MALLYQLSPLGPSTAHSCSTFDALEQSSRQALDVAGQLQLQQDEAELSGAVPRWSSSPASAQSSRKKPKQSAAGRSTRGQLNVAAEAAYR
jgi:hypothetical protein